MPKFLIFDYGETLAHEDDYRPDLGFAAILEHASRNSQGLDAQALLESFQQCFKDLRLRVHAAGAEIPNLDRWKWLFEMYDLEFALPPLELEAVYWNAAAPCVETPGMRKLLALLRQSGVGTGVVSNMGFTSASLAARLEELYPEHRFQFVLSSADYVLRKPDLRLFQLALKKAGCRAEEAWFLGDNLQADITGAAAAGMTAVHYKRDLGCAYRQASDLPLPEGAMQIEDWSELYPYFNSEAEEIHKLLYPFLDENGRLKQYPAKRKKRNCALLYLASKLEAGKIYSEPEINELLNQWHIFHDPATLRRALYDCHILDRTADCRAYQLSHTQPTLMDLE